MSFITELFALCKKYTSTEEKTSTKEKTSNDSLYQIEYYPLTNKYYPTYKGQYLYLHPQTGIFSYQDYMAYAQNFTDEQAAIKCLSIFKEQHFKANVKYIDVKF
jgi:hypothetical protein